MNHNQDKQGTKEANREKKENRPPHNGRHAITPVCDFPVTACPHEAELHSASYSSLYNRSLHLHPCLLETVLVKFHSLHSKKP